MLDPVKLAEGEGFEPPVRLPAQRLSRPPRSTTPASLRGKALVDGGRVSSGSLRPAQGRYKPAPANVRRLAVPANARPSSKMARCRICPTPSSFARTEPREVRRQRYF